MLHLLQDNTYIYNCKGRNNNLYNIASTQSLHRRLLRYRPHYHRNKHHFPLHCRYFLLLLHPQYKYRLHRLTLSSLVFGASLYAAGLGADGVGPVALLTAGQDPTGFFDGSGLWVTSLFVAGTILYGLGLISMVVTLNNAGQLLGAARLIAFLGALLFACAPAILSGWALYGVAAAAFMVFIPVARMVARQA